jgi:hypothetical protein
MIKRFLTLLLLLMASSSITSLALENDTIISFIIYGTGKDIYELEGHAALRVHTPQSDCAVTYGMFDFNSPNFVYRFVKGETDYRVAAIDFERFQYGYLRDNRSVTEYILNLTAEEKMRVMYLLGVNLQPENVVYRYNYVKDNCATRPLAIVEKAIGDTVNFGNKELPYKTFREEMAYYHTNYPWYQFGIDLALGSGIDYTITQREKNFAPETMAQLLPDATVNGRKLVSEVITLNQGEDGGAILPPTPFHLTPIFIFSLLFIFTLCLTKCDIKRGKASRWFDTILFLVIGLAGCLLTFLIFVSVHEATSPNYLYLWLNPLALIPVFTIWSKRCNKITRGYFYLNLVLCAIMILGWYWMPQSGNIAFIPLILTDLIRTLYYIKYME